MRKDNKEMLRVVLRDYRKACQRMQAEITRNRDIEAGFYDEWKRPDPEALIYWISAAESMECAIESVLYDE